MVKYFHPFLAYRDVDWDAALVEAAPAVVAAGTAEAYRGAVDRLLGFLDDPTTRTIPVAAGAAGAAGAGGAPRRDAAELALHRAGGVAVLVATDHDRFFAPDAGLTVSRLLDEAADAEALVLDLRRLGGAARAAWQVERAVANALPRLIDRPVPTAAWRHRMHSGHRQQRGPIHGGYYSAFVAEQGHVLVPAQAPFPRRPLAFVLNGGSAELLAALAGLQAAGLASVVWEGVLGAEPGVSAYPLTLAGGLWAQVRLDELVYPDGGVGFRADAAVPESDAAAWPANPAVAAAIEAVLRSPTPRPHPAPPPASASYERDYPEMGAPASPYRLLALFRFWNAIRYFFPYRHLLERAWDEVLRDHLPRFAREGDAEDYALCVARLAAETQDTHAFVNSVALRRYLGSHWPPVYVREIEGQSVVTHVLGGADTGGPAPPDGPAVGDVVVAVDGEPAATRRARMAPLLAASTPQALRWRLDRVVLCGAQGSTVSLTLRGADGQTRALSLTRTMGSTRRPHRTLPVFGVLPEGFGYVDLERLTVPQVDEAFEAVMAAPGLIFDMRGYPNSTAWPIAPWLTATEVVTARFRTPELHSPAPEDHSERYSHQTARPSPKGRYPGRVVVLINEEAISQSEHTCLFLETAAEVTFIGSPTNGANGNVTNVVLPGGASVGFTGMEVTHADGRRLQRTGIQPHVRVEPTIAGIRAGRDEELEAAIAFLRDHPGPGFETG